MDSAYVNNSLGKFNIERNGEMGLWLEEYVGFRESFGFVTCWFSDERSLSMFAEGNEPVQRKERDKCKERGWNLEHRGGAGFMKKILTFIVEEEKSRREFKIVSID